MTGPVTLGVIGTGWRAEFFLRLAAALPDVETVGIAVRRPAAAASSSDGWPTGGTRAPR